jgi:hypothetical protein
MDDRAGGYCIEGDRCTCNAPPRDDEARIERAASKFYERLRGAAIKYGAAPAWDDLSGVQRVPWIEDARQALAAADLAPEADHA